MASTSKQKYKFDLVVIGGGSGGLACAREAIKYGKRVAVIDFVIPTPELGIQWGLGGTSVNVGCIPKKLMHEASLIGEKFGDSFSYGWGTRPGVVGEIADKPIIPYGNQRNIRCNWKRLVHNVQCVVKMTNFMNRIELRTKQVTYLNAYAKFVDKHTIKLKDRKGEKTKITSEKFIIATGQRPKYPDETQLEGAMKYGITSDDLFSLPYIPGKTLIIGGSYVAMECAGFLSGLGFDVVVMARADLLQGFDQEMADKVVQYMEKRRIKIHRNTVPVLYEEWRDGTPKIVRVTAIKEGNTEEPLVEDFNTILYAIGREPNTKNLGLDKVGVKVNPDTGRIPTKNEQTNIDNIYAIGDVLEYKKDFATVAMESGILLIKRLYGGSKETFDYDTVPTCLYTPNEYAWVGLNEEEAILKYGEANLEIFHANFVPYERAATERPAEECYAKMFCLLKEKLRVVAFHYLGPNACEITQVVAMAMRFKATKSDLDKFVGIHPTTVGLFTKMTITKRSGLSPLPPTCLA